MMVLPSPAGESHPHQSGVRLGKCQANRKVNSADPPAGIDFCWHSAPTALREAGSLSNCPSSEKASQNNIGEFHQRPFGHPRQYVVFAFWPATTASANVPRIGSPSAKLGLVMRSPSNPFAVRCSFTRASSTACAAPVMTGVLTGLSIEKAIATSAAEVAGLLTR